MKRDSKQRNESVAVLKERYKLCPACGNFSPDSAKQTFCVICGEKLIHECESCREPILNPTARFCPGCGAALLKKAGGLDSYRTDS